MVSVLLLAAALYTGNQSTFLPSQKCICAGLPEMVYMSGVSCEGELGAMTGWVRLSTFIVFLYDNTFGIGLETV